MWVQFWVCVSFARCSGLWYMYFTFTRAKLRAFTCSCICVYVHVNSPPRLSLDIGQLFIPLCLLNTDVHVITWSIFHCLHGICMSVCMKCLAFIKHASSMYAYVWNAFALIIMACFCFNHHGMLYLFESLIMTIPVIVPALRLQSFTHNSPLLGPYLESVKKFRPQTLMQTL